MSSYLAKVLGQREDVLLVTRHHWFILMRSILVEGVMIATIIILVTLGQIFLGPQYPWIPWLFLLILFPLISLIWDVATFNNHAFIVTNRRVIQIDGVFNKNVIDSSLEKVNDVKMVQSFLGRIFNFGDIEIMTASELGINKFKTIANPIQFKTAMLNAKATLESNAQVVQSGPDIPTLIAQLDNLRKQGVLNEEEFQKKKAELLSKL